MKRPDLRKTLTQNPDLALLERDLVVAAEFRGVVAAGNVAPQEPEHRISRTVLVDGPTARSENGVELLREHLERLEVMKDEDPDDKMERPVDVNAQAAVPAAEIRHTLSCPEFNR